MAACVKHGVVPAPYRFFEKIQVHLLAAGSGCLLLAEWQDRLVAADLLLWDGRRLFYKFNVSGRRASVPAPGLEPALLGLPLELA